MGIPYFTMVYYIYIYIYYGESMVKYSILQFTITYYGFTYILLHLHVDLLLQILSKT